jgi:hypothetical protein
MKKMKNKKLVKAFVQECIDVQDWEARFKANHIEFENYFKYSGRIEEDKILISHWKYDHNHNCNDIHEQFIKVKEYEKNKKNANKFSKNSDPHYWNETKNSVWSD